MKPLYPLLTVCLLTAAATAAGQSPSEGWLAPLLAKPGIDVLLVVGDLEKSTKFYAEGIGMKPVGKPKQLADGAVVQELQFGATLFRLRRPAKPPADGPTVSGVDLKQQIVAAKGFRLLFLLVDDSGPIGQRLEKLGFAAPIAATTSGVGGYKLAADPDGNVLGLQMPRGRGIVPSLQLALTVSDEARWRKFLGDALGLPYAGSIPLRSQQMTEYRYMVGQSAVKFWGPPGVKPCMAGPIDARRGVQACVFAVTNLAKVEKELTSRGLTPIDDAASRSERTLTVADADGNRFQFIERPASGDPLPTPPPTVRRESGTLSESFARFDRNRDGRVTPDELRNKPVFERLDRNQDGAITRDEVAGLGGASRRGTRTAEPSFEPKPRQPQQGGPLLFDGWPGPATTAAAGETQLFEQVFIKGITDVAEPVQGAAVVDLNRDGRPDLVLVHKGRIRLMANQGNFRFQEQRLQLEGELGGSQSPTFADFNGDGFLDFYLSTVATRNHANFFLSQGRWDKFQDYAIPLGVDNPGAYARGQVSVGDVNGDGWLDMAIAANAIGSGGPRGGRPLSRLYVYRPAQDGVYEHGRFEDLGGSAAIPGFGGVDPHTPNPAKDVNGMCCVLRDLDGDGALDLVRAAHNDMLRGDPLDPFATGACAYGVFAWRNRLKEAGAVRFEPLAPGPGSLAEHGKARYDRQLGHYIHERSALAGETVLTGDVDNDGRLDVLVTGVTGPEVMVHSLWTAGRYWHNEGDFRFSDATRKAGLDPLNWHIDQWHAFWGCPLPADRRAGSTAPRDSTPKPKGSERFALKDHLLYFGNSVLADFNNDGWLDLFQVTRYGGQGDVRGSWRSNLLLNRGDGTFALAKTELSGVNEMGLAAFAADLDGDGRLEAILIRREERAPETPCMIFWNTGRQFGAAANRWLEVRLTGLPERQLIGAQLYAHDPDANRLLGRRDYFVDAMRGSYDPTAHFGLGALARVNVRVILPGGAQITFPDIQAGQRVTLDVVAHRPIAASRSTP